MKYVVTSTWGQIFVIADEEMIAEEHAEVFLTKQGYTDPYNMLIQTEEYDPDYHGEWEGEL